MKKFLTISALVLFSITTFSLRTIAAEGSSSVTHDGCTAQGQSCKCPEKPKPGHCGEARNGGDLMCHCEPHFWRRHHYRKISR